MVETPRRRRRPEAHRRDAESAERSEHTRPESSASSAPPRWDTRLYLVTFRIRDEVAFFNAGLALGRRRPATLRLRHWLISADGATSYALWEATEAAVLMGVLDVEFGESADYELTEVNLLYAG